MKRSVPVWFVLLLFTLLLAAAAPASAEPAPRRSTVSSSLGSFEQAKKSYNELRSSDPKVLDLVAWERTAAKLTKFVDDNPKAPQAPEAYFLLGELFERTFRERSFRPGLAKAVYFYERLAKEHSGHQLVPEALLKLGDLRRSHLNDEAAARAAYYEIVDVYPKSQTVQVAKTRLGITEPAAPAPEPVAAPAPEPAAPERKSFLETLFSGEPRVGSEGKEIFDAGEVNLKRPVIVIDPGHGGDEHGAIGVNGLPEKEVVLKVSQYLDELLRERLRAKTILTRSKDVTLSLAERTKIANDHGADLFISVHANASEYKTVRGIETYYLDNTNDKSSLKLAQRENASLPQAGTDLGFIISDFIQSAKLDESISLAHHLQRGLHGSLARYYEGVKDLGVKKAPFYVLVGAHMPCVLTEISFIDHPAEGARLGTTRYQRLAALGLYQGIKSYFEQRNK